MRTERLYYVDPYLRSFQASLVRTTEDRSTVYLDRSAFYPTSGGQAADLGWINGIPVVDVRDEGDWIAHQLERPLGDAVEVSAELDWRRRYDNMQQHTGQHLLSAVIEALFGYPTVSVHMGVQISTIELASPEFSDQQAAKAEARCAELIAAALPVRITFEYAAEAAGLRKASERTGPLRIIEIADVDRSACGGTHVKSTAELSLVQIRRREKVRNNTRLEFVAGTRALDRVRQDYRIAAELSRACTVAIDDLPASVSPLRQRLVEAEKERQRISLELARRQGADLFAACSPGAEGIRRTLLTPATLTDEARVMAQAFAEGGRAVALVLATDAPSVLVAAASDSGIHAGNLLKQVLTDHGGKGGGTATVAQGSLASAEGRRELQTALGF
ncbi:MAG: DHHA1 domain-containing protein [Bryobacteraceae bacterium]